MSNEIELKLALPRKALTALRRHSLVAGAEKLGTTVTLDNTYFDTPDLALRARRIAVRTRKQGRHMLQTVKCAAASTGGLSSRPEWEQSFSGRFDFSAINAPKVRKQLERRAADLGPVFTTRFRRETRRYAPNDATSILLMIDTGEILAGDRRTPICELELELERGTPADLLDLAATLSADLPLWPEDASKAQRGFRLHLDEHPAPVRPEPSTVTPGDSTRKAFTTLAFSCLRQWQANAAGALDHEDAEFIHQMRVALRRLRSLLSVFAPALPAEFAAAWRAPLAANADELGGARDLDVLYEELLLPLAGEVGVEPALEDLIAHAARARREARKTARDHLAPAAQGRLQIGLMRDLHALATLAAESDDRGDTIDAFAHHRLDRLLRRVARRLDRAADRAPESLHDLRIAIKRLRYALEFFAPLLPAKPLRRYRKAIARAQTALGFLNDVDVARTRLAAWGANDAALRAAGAFVSGWHGARYARLARRTIRELHDLLAITPPWQR